MGAQHQNCCLKPLGRAATKPRRGKLVQFILELFESDPDGAWNTYDIAVKYYGVDRRRVTRSHRSAIARAIKCCLNEHVFLATTESSGPSNPTVIYNKTSVLSLAISEIKGKAFHNPYNSTEMFGDNNTIVFYRRSLENRTYRDRDEWVADELAQDRYQESMAEGGHIWLNVEHAKAVLAGDTKRVEELDAVGEAANAAAFAKLAAILNRTPSREARLQQIVQTLIDIEATPEELDGVVASAMGSLEQQS